MTLTKLVIYHANCVDGFTSAWVAKNALQGSVEFVAAHHNQPAPDVTGKEVYICDFSYPREILLDMHSKAASLVVLDHHKTAQEALTGIDFCFFDMHRCGAAMTWDYFHNHNQPGSRHWLVDYVQDRDLWTWALKDSKAISSAISCRPFSFIDWDEMANKSPFLLSLEGTVIEQYKETQMELHLKQAYITTFDGKEVPALNATSLNSELANVLSKGYDFAVVWSFLGNGLYRYSLRTNSTFDTTEVAKKYGGGGHQAASGFTYKDFIAPFLRPFQQGSK